MSTDDIKDELEIEPDLITVATRLDDARPLPSPAYRGQLRRHLLSGEARRAHQRRRASSPSSARLWVAGYAGAGALLLVIACAGLAGAGPLSA